MHSPVGSSISKDETASGTDFWTAIAQYPQCSIYFSAFLANLNARRFIRGDGEGITFEDSLQFAPRTTTGRDARASVAMSTEMRSVPGQTGHSTDTSGTDGLSTANGTVSFL